MRLFANSRMLSLINTEKNEGMQMEMGLLTRTIEDAQKKIESINFSRRKSVLTYDDVMNQQRNIIYKQRGDVLNDSDLRQTLTAMLTESVGSNFDFYVNEDDKNFEGLRTHYFGLLCTKESYNYSEEELDALSPKKLAALREELIERALSLYQSKDALFGEENMREVERAILLRTVDEKWMDHIDAMDDLRDSISLNAYAQRNPVSEYRIMGMQMFEDMVTDIRDTTVRRLLSVVPQEKVVRVQTANPLMPNERGAAPVRGKIARTANGVAIGRNSPCPCGSGKRYKRCCGAGKED
jgi:preprotein translocase subunit SecA